MWRTNFGLVIAALLGFLALFGPAEGSDVNLVAHWTFDEGSGTTAYDSAGDNDGTFIGDPCWTTGQVGGALEFDGVDDYVSCGTGPAITGIGPFAVSAWVKTSTAEGGNLVVQRSTTSANGSYGVHIRDDGRAQFYVYNDGFGFLLQSSITVNDGLWHHIAVVRTNSTDGEIYVDGSLSGTDSGPARSLINVPIWIGGRYIPSYTIDGKIDEVMIFDGALSPMEVERIYWEGIGGLELAIFYCGYAIGEKEEALVGIDAALETEWGAYAELEELLASGDYGDLSKRDISAAQREIESSIRREERSQRVVLDSIDELEDALLSLGWEPAPEPNVPEPEPNVPEPNSVG